MGSREHNFFQANKDKNPEIAKLVQQGNPAGLSFINQFMDKYNLPRAFIKYNQPATPPHSPKQKPKSKPSSSSSSSSNSSGSSSSRIILQKNTIKIGKN